MDAPPSEKSGTRIWLARVGWLALIWTASVAALGLAAGLMRWVMRAAGMV
ncbi:MAG: DUF2474 domain-containing protein [Burkholderiaceae bacterium]